MRRAENSQGLELTLEITVGLLYEAPSPNASRLEALGVIRPLGA